MSGTNGKPVIPISIGAGTVIQLLAGVACFLAAFALPGQIPEVAGLGQNILMGLGGFCFFVAFLSIVFRRFFAKLAQKIGMRSRVMVPREGLVYLGIMLIIAIAALTGGNPDTGNMLLLIFGMMAGPFVLNGWVVVAMLARVSVERSVPAVASAGAYFSVEITLKNDKRFLSSRLVEVRDQIQGHSGTQEATVTFVRVGPEEARTSEYQLRIARRGRFTFGPIRISSQFPLGIGERGHTLPVEDEIIIHPALGRLLPGWSRRERELAEAIQETNARLGIFDDEFHGIREYRPGDNPRAIHWRSSARHGQLMVKEHQQHRQSDLTVLLDLFQTQEFTPELQETAISLAATLCVEQTRHTASGMYRLGIAGRKTECLEVSGSTRFREAALKSLAMCEPTPRAELASLLLTICQGSIAVNQKFVLITSRPEAARLLSEAIARDNLRNEIQLTSRLMILPARAESLQEVFASFSSEQE